MESKFLLSIIIPTRNREDYAFSCIDHIYNSTTSKTQIVVQDNSDNNSIEIKLDKFEDRERIKYNHSKDILSFVDNFSRGVELADGEYLCIIGDDDGINPEIEKFVMWAKTKKINSISPKIRLNYIWPGTGINYYNTDSGNLMIVDFDSKIKFHKTDKEILKLLSKGGQNYLKYNFAKIYHGIVTKEAMNQVKKITGRYFGGLSPDIYSAVALTLVVDKVMVIDYPLTIPGVCRKSGSGHSSTGRHHGELNTAPQLVGHKEYKWAKQVPKFYSVETLWADSAIVAFTDMKKNTLLKKFDVATLSAYCYKNYKEFSHYTKDNYEQYCKENNLSSIGAKTNLIKGYLKGPATDIAFILFGKIRRLLMKSNSTKNYSNIADINEASFCFQNFLKSKKYNILNVLSKIK